MNAQLSISDCEDDMPSFKSKSEPEKVQSVPIPISSNESQVPVAPCNHKDAFPIQQPTDEVLSQGSPFQVICFKIFFVMKTFDRRISFPRIST